MTIDLSLKVSGPIKAEEFIKNTRKTLNQLLKIFELPMIELYRVEAGKNLLDPRAQIADRDSLHVLCFAGRTDATVAVISSIEESAGCRSVTFSVGANRSPAEYVLAVSAAIALGALCNSNIVDGWSFWTGDEAHDAQGLLKDLSLQNAPSTFDEACEMLLGSRGYRPAP